jgi:uncharacterized protein (TIGR02996 family)
MHDEQEFLALIHERPHDEGLRQVFADWLEEAGDERAEFFRIDAQLKQMEPGDPDRRDLLRRWRDLRDELPPEWQRLLSRSVVENCGLSLHPCPQKWNSLDATPEAGIRHCWACDRQVHYCQSLDELRVHAREGHCVAIDPQIAYQPRDLGKWDEDRTMTLGFISDEF